MQSFRNKPFTILVQICSVFACSIKMQPQPVCKPGIPIFFLRNWRLDFFYSDYPAYSIPAGAAMRASASTSYPLQFSTWKPTRTFTGIIPPQYPSICWPSGECLYPGCLATRRRQYWLVRDTLRRQTWSTIFYSRLPVRNSYISHVNYLEMGVASPFS